MTIGGLTPEQEAALAIIRDEWLRVGLSTEPADRPRAEAAISEIYRLIGEPQPQFIWCDSPIVGLLTVEMAKLLARDDPRGDALRALLSDTLRSSLLAALEAAGSIDPTLKDSFESWLEASLKDSLEAWLKSPRMTPPRESLSSSIQRTFSHRFHAAFRERVEKPFDTSCWMVLERSTRMALEFALRNSPVFRIRDLVWDASQALLLPEPNASTVSPLRDAVRVLLEALLDGKLGPSPLVTLRTATWDRLMVALDDSVEEAFPVTPDFDPLESVRASLPSVLRRSLDEAIVSFVIGSIWKADWRTILSETGKLFLATSASTFWQSLAEMHLGQYEAYWVCFYDFAAKHLGVEYDPRRKRQLELWGEVARSAGFWWPYRGVVFVCERPEVVRVEPDPRQPDAYRLHCADGPALRYRDGWSVYVWHGMHVPERAITAPETMAAQQIMDEEDVEVRRVMLERFGPSRYVQEIGARVVHKDDWGTLYWADMPGDDPLVMVRVVNSTLEPDGSAKDYWLRVHPELRPLLSNGRLGPPQKLTARNAVASTFGLTGEEYNPTVQT